ncbi:hypothetical protein GCM10020219_020870 [Nonomuraea dietziae]
MPAAYERLGKGDYGNHDRLGSKRRVDYIVIHDTDGHPSAASPTLVKNPRYVSWHYTIRSRDGHVAQHVRTNDVAWHAGNWDVNSPARSASSTRATWPRAAPGTPRRCTAPRPTWCATWRTSNGVPLDRAPHHRPRQRAGHHRQDRARHARGPLGHYWDWARFFALMGAPIQGDGRER